MVALTTGPTLRRRNRLLPPPQPMPLPPPPPSGGILRVTCPSTPVCLAVPPLERGALGVRSLKMAMKKRLLGEDETFPREAMLLVGVVRIETSSKRKLTSVSSSCSGGGSTSSCSSNSVKRKKRKSFEETEEEEEEGGKEDRRGGRKERGAATTTSTLTPATPTPIFSTTATTTKAMRVFHILLGGVFPGVAVEATATATVEMMAAVVVVRAGHECSLFLRHRRRRLPLPPLPPLLLPRAGGEGGQTGRGRWVPRRRLPRVPEGALRMPG